jgi:Ni/Co efflux regulator RcnB
MKIHLHVILSTTLLIVGAGTIAVAQDRGQRGGQNSQQNSQFNDHDQQVAHDWYSQHQSNPPAGFRNRDRLSPEEESRMREGTVLDKGLRKKIHPAPADLSRQLPPPPNNHRYVAVGGHVALIDNSFQVKGVIHLH